MPRGGARPNTGGKRAGAGRKKGAGTTRTTKTNAIAEKAAGDGVLPLQAMLKAMREHYGNEEWDAAAEIAAKAAPYIHPRLSSVQVKSEVDATLEVTFTDDFYSRASKADPPAQADAPPNGRAHPPGPVQGAGVR